jgi:hypothetical protein
MSGAGVPPEWLTIVEYTRDMQYDVVVNHGEQQARFSCPSYMSRNDLMHLVMRHKKRMIDNAALAAKVADALTPKPDTPGFFSPI